MIDLGDPLVWSMCVSVTSMILVPLCIVVVLPKQNVRALERESLRSRRPPRKLEDVDVRLGEVEHRLAQSEADLALVKRHLIGRASA